MLEIICGGLLIIIGAGFTWGMIAQCIAMFRGEEF